MHRRYLKGLSIEDAFKKNFGGTFIFLTKEEISPNIIKISSKNCYNDMIVRFIIFLKDGEWFDWNEFPSWETRIKDLKEKRREIYYKKAPEDLSLDEWNIDNIVQEYLFPEKKKVDWRPHDFLPEDGVL